MVISCSENASTIAVIDVAALARAVSSCLRRRVLRLLVKDVLIGPQKITIRHRIPVREPASRSGGHHDTTDTEGDMRPSYELCWGRDRCPLRRALRGL